MYVPISSYMDMDGYGGNHQQPIELQKGSLSCAGSYGAPEVINDHQPLNDSPR